MLITLDLTRRQIARVLEQAIRAHCGVEIETRTRPDDRPICGTLHDRRENVLRVDVPEQAVDQPLERLIAAFCDVRMTVAGELYLFTTCVIEVTDETVPRRMLLAVPDAMQVANRRKFLRRSFAQDAEVRIVAEEFDEPLRTTLSDISGDGLACHGPRVALDTLLVGDGVLLEFDLPGCAEHFHLAATVCSKTPADGRDSLIIGLEFNVVPGDTEARDAIDRLRELLIRDSADATRPEGQA